MDIKLTTKAVKDLEPGASDYFAWDSTLKGFGLKVAKTGRKTFVAQYRLRGEGRSSKRVTIGAFGTWTTDQARDRALEIIRDASLPPQVRAQEQAKVEDAVEKQSEKEKKKLIAKQLRFERVAVRFMRDHVRLKRKKKTIDGYRQLIVNHMLPAFKGRDMREITRADVSKLHRKLSDTPPTANRVIAVLSSIYGFAEIEGLLPDDVRRPTQRIEKYKEEGKEVFLSSEQIERLGAAIREAETIGTPWEIKEGANTKHIANDEHRYTKIDPDAAAALRLLIFTGARLREILNLTWHEVDLERGLLRLKDSKTGRKTILLNGPARAIISSLAETRSSEYVFAGESKDGTPQPRSDLKRPWAAVKKLAGLEGVRLHDLRHSFASAGAGSGHGLIVIGKLLGHSQSSTTERYAHLADDPLRQASESIANKIAASMGDDYNPVKAKVIPLNKNAG